jgi:cellulose biosynthesis protein BcsQ
MPKILLIDADAQASISALRKRDMELCKLDMEGKEFLSLDANAQAAIKEMRVQFEALFSLKSGITTQYFRWTRRMTALRSLALFHLLKMADLTTYLLICRVLCTKNIRWIYFCLSTI